MVSGGGDTPLKQELDRRGIRYSWMASRLGVKPWTFTRIEGGEQTRPDDWYERAAEILGVAVDNISPQEQIAA